MGLQRSAVVQWLLAHPKDFTAIVAEHASDDAIKAWRNRRAPGQVLKAGADSAATRRISSLIYSQAPPSSPASTSSSSIHQAKLDLPKAATQLLDLLELDALAQQLISDLSVHFSSGHCLLFVHNPDRHELELVTPKAWYTGPRNFPLGQGLAGSVANTQTMLNLGPEAIGHDGFNPQLDAEPSTSTQSVLVVPILHKGSLVGVAQVVNRAKTVSMDEATRTYLQSAGIALNNASVFERALKECRALNVLLSLARNIFQDLDSMNKVVKKIISDAATLVDCDQCSLFMLDAESNELVATAFDAMAPESTASDVPKQIRFPKNKGVAGHVATTGEVLIIPNAYDDPRFNSAVDKQTGYHTRNILCMPIYNKTQEIVGVAQLVNKAVGSFTKEDERLFEAFAVFCGLGIQSVQLYEETQKAAYRNKVVLEVLSYHARANNDDTAALLARPVPSDAKWELNTFDHDSVSLETDDTMLASVRMFINLGFVEEFRIPRHALCQWLLSVQKNYRPVTYHNWRHAFSVTQCMYAMLHDRKIKENFTMLERLALIVACLCHDLDHRGTNNAFQQHTKNALSQLYSTSTMEHHHFDQCLMILNQEGNNFLNNISVEDYSTFLRLLKAAILSTDLSLYLASRNQYFDIVVDGSFDFANTEHRRLLQAMLMTAADISAITRPWHVQHQVAEVVYAEFFEQGDAQRELGTNVEPLLDRNKVDELPKMQLGFIDFICMPVYKHLAQHLPSLQPMVDNVSVNRDHWAGLQGRYDGFSSCSLISQSQRERHSTKDQVTQHDLEAQDSATIDQTQACDEAIQTSFHSHHGPVESSISKHQESEQAQVAVLNSSAVSKSRACSIM
eukprot:m.93403 g.93403  ORF g.93403 m.93403 type:complete len:848 (+) comp14984_c0_seq2:193-2736(+)